MNIKIIVCKVNKSLSSKFFSGKGAHRWENNYSWKIIIFVPVTMCTANLLDKANNPEADFASLLFATYARVRTYMKRCLDFKYNSSYLSQFTYLWCFVILQWDFNKSMINVLNEDKYVFTEKRNLMKTLREWKMYENILLSFMERNNILIYKIII